MADVDFLDLVPGIVDSATVTIHADSGPVDIEVREVPLSELAFIAKRYPDLIKLIERGVGESLIAVSDGLPSLIAAAMGHPRSPEYEAKVLTWCNADILRMGAAVSRLCIADPEPLPLPGPGLGNGAEHPEMPPEAHPGPLQLNS